MERKKWTDFVVKEPVITQSEFEFRGKWVSLKTFIRMYLDERPFKRPKTLEEMLKEQDLLRDFYDIIDHMHYDIYWKFLDKLHRQAYIHDWLLYRVTWEWENWDFKILPLPVQEPEDHYSALDSFSINFEVLDYYIFDNTSINIFLNFFLIILFFSIIYTNNFNLKNNLNVINLTVNFLNFFF